MRGDGDRDGDGGEEQRRGGGEVKKNHRRLSSLLFLFPFLLFSLQTLSPIPLSLIPLLLLAGLDQLSIPPFLPCLISSCIVPLFTSFHPLFSPPLLSLLTSPLLSSPPPLFALRLSSLLPSLLPGPGSPLSPQSRGIFNCSEVRSLITIIEHAGSLQTHLALPIREQESTARKFLFCRLRQKSRRSASTSSSSTSFFFFFFLKINKIRD